MGFFDIFFALIALIILNTGIRLVLLARKMDEQESMMFVARAKFMFGLMLYAVVLLPRIILTRIKYYFKEDE